MRPTDGWRLVALEDGSSSSSDPEEAALYISGEGVERYRLLTQLSLHDFSNSL